MSKLITSSILILMLLSPVKSADSLKTNSNTKELIAEARSLCRSDKSNDALELLNTALSSSALIDGERSKLLPAPGRYG